MNDSDIYVDSEEDEVFFGTFNDEEDKISSKLIEGSVWNSASKNHNTHVLKNDKDETNNSIIVDGENCIAKIGLNKGSENSQTESIIRLPSSTQIESESNDSFSHQEFHSLCSNNTSVELDHNYSCAKQKIDESILATPKSVVKADKDGGFLKVLSEIALVKAEADNKLEADRKIENNASSGQSALDDRGDEDKENKVNQLPEIRVTEPTPEKTTRMSPSHKAVGTSFRKFKIIYTSPNSSAIDGSQKVKAKSFTENQTSNVSRTSIRKSWLDDTNAENSLSNKTKAHTESPKKSRGNSWPNSTETSQNPIEVIDLLDESFIQDEHTDVNDNSFQENGAVPKVDTQRKDSENFPKNSMQIETHPRETNDTESALKDGTIPNFSKIMTLSDAESENNCHLKGPGIESKEMEPLTFVPAPKSPLKHLPFKTEASPKPAELPKRYRFSREARKIVEALKTSTEEDTFNFTIPEIDLDDVENSFLSPESVPLFDQTIAISKESLPRDESLRQPLTKTPIDGTVARTGSSLSEKGPNKLKYFAESKLQQVASNDVDKCSSSTKQLVVKTPLSLKSTQSCEKKYESRIPVAGVKPSKIPSSTLLGSRFGGSKVTPYKRSTAETKGNACRTPAGKTSKFKNVASPISAYIHNRPTALVVNVKAQNRKDGAFLSAGKLPAEGNIWKNPDKTPKKELKLPFVEYKSATPFEIEKRSESRLPRLTPTVERLIGNSPRILAHKGRFYMKTPVRKESANVDATITADPNEVSVLVSQLAQKASRK